MNDFFEKIADRLWPVRKGDDIYCHRPDGIVVKYTMRGYALGYKGNDKTISLIARLTDINGDEYAAVYKELAHLVRINGGMKPYEED